MEYNFKAKLCEIKKVSFFIKYIAELESGDLSMSPDLNIEGCEKKTTK